MSRQLVFELPLRESRARDDFIVTPANALALSALEDWPRWPGAKALLIGPACSGKTHLATLWASETGATITPALRLGPELVPWLAEAPAVIEDAHLIGGTPAEDALFHLHNLLAAQEMPLLVTARTPPRDWGLGLADLASRMQAAPILRMNPPDDGLLRAVMAKLFTDRQLHVAPDVIEWLAARMTRSLEAAHQAVAALDAIALAQARPITRQMAADWLGADPPGPNE